MRSAWLPLLALLLVGCGDNVVFQEDLRVPEEGWTRNWRPSFAFEVNDTITPHDVYLDIRHTGDYPYSNFYCFLSLTGPDGVSGTDTVECLLADPTGRWYGKGTGFIISDRFHAHVLYRSRGRFPRSGTYTLRMEQAMRTDTLRGVIDVGISVERTGNSGN